MDDPNLGTVTGAADGGVAGTHAGRTDLRVLAAPATAEQFNTVRSAVFPIACFKVEDLRFDFGSSLVLPELRTEMPLLAQLIADHAEPDGAKRPPPASVFGHADPVGDDEFNKGLSGRRAAAIYGMLTRRPQVWEDLYAGTGKYAPAVAGDVWGLRSIQLMLNGLPDDGSGAAPLDVDGRTGPATRDAVERFQSGLRGIAAHLAVDGDPGPATRTALYMAYMDAICVDVNGAPFQLDPTTGFLARDADPGGKGDFQGCSEFNPGLLFSRADKAAFDAADDHGPRDAANAPNRRVVVLLFRPGATVSTGYWPCPRAKEGTAGCRKRFWSDGDARRTNGEVERRFATSQDTFACRFYQRLVTGSPCETPGPVRLGRLHMQVLDADGTVVLAGRAYAIGRADQPDVVRFRGTLDADGILLHDRVPDGDFVLAVAGCGETSPMIVLDLADDVPQVRHLETSALAIFVRTPDGGPIAGATVSATGLGDRSTDDDGVADFGVVDPGTFTFRARKDGFQPVARAVRAGLAGDPGVGGPGLGDAEGDGNLTGTVIVAGRKAKGGASLAPVAAAKVVVKRINGSLPGTRSLRDPANAGQGPNSLPFSTSAAATPLDATVLIRGCGPFEVDAETDPPGQSVDWSIAPNQSATQKPPTMLSNSNGTTATFETDAVGSFSITATRDKTSIRWNFVVVGVDVDVDPAKVKVTTRNTFEDAATHLKTHPNPAGFNIPPTSVGAIVGEFVFGKHAWDAELTVRFTGGGPKGDVGLAGLSPRYLQNVTYCNVAAEYDGVGRGDLAINVNVTKLGNILDASGGSDPSVPAPNIGVVMVPGVGAVPQWPVSNAPGMIQVTLPTPGNPGVQSIRMGDSPSSGAFDANVLPPKGGLRAAVRIRGSLKFRAAIATWSPSAQRRILVHAVSDWIVDFEGKVTYPNGSGTAGVYVPNGAFVKAFPWGLVAAGLGGADAEAAGLETAKPLVTTEVTKPQTNTF